MVAEPLTPAPVDPVIDESGVYVIPGLLTAVLVTLPEASAPSVIVIVVSLALIATTL